MQIKKFDDKINFYFNELIKWNRKINLVSKNDINRLYERHFLESLILDKFIPKNSKMLDIGSGNGFPSVVIALTRSDVTIFSIEKTSKKAFFLKNIKNKLSLKNLVIWNIRIEEKKPNYSEYFDIITARAVASAKSIVEKSIYYASKKAKYLLYNNSQNNDLGELSTTIKKIINTVNNFVYKIEENSNKKLIIIELDKKAAIY